MNDKTKITAEKRRLMEMMLNKQHQNSVVNETTIPKRDPNKPTELSFAQQRLWFLDELTPENAAYAFCNIVRLDGKLDISVLEKSYNEIINRHENLRTTFKVIDGTPTQIITDKVELSIPVIDITNLKGDELEQKLQVLSTDEAKIPFDISKDLLIRLKFIKLAEEQYAVLQTMHHIVYDGWSLAVLFSELKNIYEVFIVGEQSPLEPLSIQYADFAVWQRTEIETERSQKQFDYWKSVLSGELPTLHLPFDKKRPSIPTYAGEMQWFEIPKSLSNQLEVLAKREESTPFMVLLTAFSILLNRYTGEDDIIIGTPIANRNKKETECLIGFFVNSLVMRTKIQDDPEFCQLLESVKNSASQAYQNQDFPFEKLVEELQPERKLSQNPIFQVMFALQNTPPPPSNINDIKLSIEEVDSGTAVFDITLSMYQNEKGINGYFEYSTEMFDKSTIVRMVESYTSLLENIVQNPENKISELTIFPEKELLKITQEWNSNTQEIPKNQCLHELIEKQAIDKPEQHAIIEGENKISYAELNERSNQLARKLRELGITGDTIVGICMQRSVDMFISILAILKSGGAYLPLDPEYPQERLSYMLKDSESRFVITTKSFENVVESESVKTICIDAEVNTTNQFDNTNLTSTINDDNLAYIIYTSGSTGKPKGVMIEHNNIVNSTLVRMNYYENSVSKFLLVSSFSFDSSVAGIFWTLCQGGELHLTENGMERDIQYVANKIQTIGVSHLLCLPSVYNLLLNITDKDNLASLNTIIVAGEACSAQLVNYHYSQLPSTSLYNEYGPTEGTVWCTVKKFNSETLNPVVTIGSPINNAQIYILDKYMKSVPIGVTGEIYIGGSGVARGYLNNVELTNDKFIEIEFQPGQVKRIYRTGDLAKYNNSGEIIYLGRIDRQIKLRGYRIELGEIEDAIHNHEAVEDVVVTITEANLINKVIEKMSNLTDVEQAKLLNEII